MTLPVIAIVPAAGIGARMNSETPKQYLKIGEKSIIEHSLEKLLAHPQIDQIIVALHPEDRRFTDIDIANHSKITIVDGGKTRAESVINALKSTQKHYWALVHDAARPCVNSADISELIQRCRDMSTGGGILAVPVQDTMKRANQTQQIAATVEREGLWHALTPQMFQSNQLLDAYQQALDSNSTVTDEASAMEYLNYPIKLVESKSTNIKITRPSDLALAEFFLKQETI